MVIRIPNVWAMVMIRVVLILETLLEEESLLEQTILAKELCGLVSIRKSRSTGKPTGQNPNQSGKKRIEIGKSKA
jgi:hypothetical protein